MDEGHLTGDNVARDMLDRSDLHVDAIGTMGLRSPSVVYQWKGPVMAKRNAASSATTAANEGVLRELPFANEEDFDNARRGLIAAGSGKITGSDGRVVWDMDLWGFLDGDAPATEYTAQHDGEATVFRLREYEFTRLDKKASDFLTKPTAKPIVEEEAAEITEDGGT